MYRQKKFPFWQNTAPPSVTDKSSKEGLKRPVSSTGGLRSFAFFEQLMGEFFGDGTHHSVKATCFGFRNRAFPTVSSWRHCNKSFESTKIDSGRTPSTTVDGCLAGRRPVCGRQEIKTCHRLAGQNGEAGKTTRIDSLRFLVCTR